jgi:2-keto-4-pentenoate hydratase
VNEARVERCAERLLRSWRTRRPIDLLDDEVPASTEEAHAIQARLAAGFGRPAGYKVGYTNPEAQRRFGVSAPISGQLIRERVFASGATIPVPGMLDLVVEPEFAYRMGEDLRRADAPFSDAQIAGAVDAILPALEVVEPRLAGWQACGPLPTVADNVLHSALVVGEPVREWRASALPSQAVVAFVDGAEASRGLGSNVLGDPFRVLCWLARDLAARGAELRAGDYVTTGCVTAVLRPARHSEVSADFGGFGRVAARFTSHDAVRAGGPGNLPNPRASR